MIGCYTIEEVPQTLTFFSGGKHGEVFMNWWCTSPQWEVFMNWWGTSKSSLQAVDTDSCEPEGIDLDLVGQMKEMNIEEEEEAGEGPSGGGVESATKTSIFDKKVASTKVRLCRWIGFCYNSAAFFSKQNSMRPQFHTAVLSTKGS